MMAKYLICLLLGGLLPAGPKTGFWSPPAAPAAVYNILDFGAVNDPRMNSQAAIQRTVDACARAGGGQVLVPAGRFATATIRLRDNIELHLASGATLYALSDSALYTNDKAGLLDAGDTFIPALIVAKNLRNISLTGPGAVVGQPQFARVAVSAPDTYPGWTENARRAGVKLEALRVRNPKVSLVYISGCQNVTLRDFQLVDSPNWSCHLQWSQDVTIRGLRISSSLARGVNADGLDIDGCQRVLVSDCIIRTGDDAICLKTTRQGGRSETCEDVSVTNCALASSSCALKIGTETHADLRRILFSNCTISETNRALGIIVRDGATVSEVVFSNLVLDCRRRPFFWWGNGEAFHFTVLRRNPDSKIGRIERVRMQGIAGRVEGTSSITGFAGAGEQAYTSIRDLELADINLTIGPESEPDKRADNGIDIRHAEHLSLRRVAVQWAPGPAEPGWQHALALHTVRDFTIEAFENPVFGALKNEAAVLLDDTQRGQVLLPSAANGQLYGEVAGRQTRSLRLQASEKSRFRGILIRREARDEVKLLK